MQLNHYSQIKPPCERVAFSFLLTNCFFRLLLIKESKLRFGQSVETARNLRIILGILGSAAEPLPKGAVIRFDYLRVALSVMGSKQRGRKGGQGFGNARPAKPLRQSQGKE